MEEFAKIRNLLLLGTKYFLMQVIAIDGGSGEDQLTTRVPVNISIADVNNKLPRLLLLLLSTTLIFITTRVEKMEPLVIAEDTPVGKLLTTVIASDPDSNSDLR